MERHVIIALFALVALTYLLYKLAVALDRGSAGPKGSPKQPSSDPHGTAKLLTELKKR